MTTENYTPKMAREILETDNIEISNLCKEARLVPKRDLNGNTYFTQRDISALQKLKRLHDKNQEIINNLKNSSTSLALYSRENEQKLLDDTFAKLNERFENFQEALSEKISSLIDDKLDGMDEVVVELIRCKTENETLRFKMNELEKMNYSLKNQLTSYKNIGFNLYIKKDL